MVLYVLRVAIVFFFSLSLCRHLCAYLSHCLLPLLPKTDRNFYESEQAAPSCVARRGPPIWAGWRNSAEAMQTIRSQFIPCGWRTRRKRSMSSTANGKTWPKAQRPLSICHNLSSSWVRNMKEHTGQSRTALQIQILGR